ncbi:MAG: ferritin-like domain-containing protein [Candidatus Thiodiazotropha sp.]
MSLERSLFKAARRCLLSATLDEKLQLTDATADAWVGGELVVKEWEACDEIIDAGSPQRPQLVHPSRLPRRGLGSESGRMAMIHAIAHIEFNAINLAWDAVMRFPDMPTAYYNDWVQVAREEVYHFSLLRERLSAGGAEYGDYPAHNGLWEMAQRTAHDPLVRMALVPRMLEARGLDVTPGIIGRFQAIGDDETVQVLQIILREEVGHVQFGSRWFHYLCQKRGVDPEQTYFDLLENFLNGEIRCPLHHEARRQAGFSNRELNRLEALCTGD